MRSIRLSLLVYLLALLAIVLGVMAWYFYAQTRQTLRAREDTMRAFLQSRYEKNCRDYEEQFDAALTRGAQRLAAMAQAQYRPLDPHYHLLGLLASGTAPCGHLLLPVIVAEATVERGPSLGSSPAAELSARVNRHFLFRIEFTDPFLGLEEDEPEFFQVYSLSGTPLQRSESLGGQSLRLTPHLRDRLDVFEKAFDEAELRPGLTVRQVTLKVPVQRERFFFPPQRRGPPNPPRKPAPSRTRIEEQAGMVSSLVRGVEAGAADARRWAPRAFFDRSSPVVLIQCARSTASRDSALAAFQQERDSDLARLEAESHATLQALRTRIFLLGLLAFGATVIGGVWLVRRGLSPIGRITEAVSQVSERDFQLRIDPKDVPHELTSIVEKLSQSLRSLERAFAREKQAAADISHELRTPIAALLATAQVCLKKPRSSEEYREALENCTEIAQQLSVLVERLLILARLDAGADHLRPQKVNVPELAAQCVSMVRPLAEARGLGVRFERNGPAVLTTDPDKLREILTNLLHNAIQYNRPQGQVELIVGRDNGTIRIEVRDTGIGIPPAAREHLFERFFRADPSRQSDTIHAGLGLAIVKGYLDLMGGRIEVESTEGQGSTFRVLLSAPADE
jgi:heavy metal sensor kinase